MVGAAGQPRQNVIGILLFNCLSQSVPSLSKACVAAWPMRTSSGRGGERSGGGVGDRRPSLTVLGEAEGRERGGNLAAVQLHKRSCGKCLFQPPISKAAESFLLSAPTAFLSTRLKDGLRPSCSSATSGVFHLTQEF